jgi:hypothetical protein
MKEDRILESDSDRPGGRRTLEHFTGCLLGGAVGDALGAPVEFHSLELIRKKYGSAGITDYDLAYGRRGAITDDTWNSGASAARNRRPK